MWVLVAIVVLDDPMKLLSSAADSESIAILPNPSSLMGCGRAPCLLRACKIDAAVTSGIESYSCSCSAQLALSKLDVFLVFSLCYSDCLELDLDFRKVFPH